MTHDELLNKLDKMPCNPDNKEQLMLYVTLRAVVELTDFVLDTEPSQDDKDYNLGYLVAMYNVFKAIEKELG